VAIIPIPRPIIATIVSAIIWVRGWRIVIIRGWGWIIISWGIEKGIKDNTRSYPGRESRPEKAPMMGPCGRGLAVKRVTIKLNATIKVTVFFIFITLLFYYTVLTFLNLYIIFLNIP